MTKLLIHIGQGKTGSTSIQNGLRNASDNLRTVGVFFPETGNHTNHQDIFTYLTGDVKHHDPRLGGARDDERKRALGKDYWNKARQTLADMRPRLVILSCENQFRPFHAKALQRLTGIVRPLFDEISVCAYLREPASHFMSSAQQDLKKRPNFTLPSNQSYRDVLEPWLVHGPGPVECARFARDALIGRDVVTDFLERFAGLRRSDLSLAGTEDNTTLSAEGMDVMQRVLRGQFSPPTRYHARYVQRMKALVMDADRSCAGYARPSLNVGLEAALRARASDLDWLEETFALRFPEVVDGGLSPAEAEARVRVLRDVSDICRVNPNRRAELEAMIAELAAPHRTILDLAFPPRRAR